VDGEATVGLDPDVARLAAAMDELAEFLRGQRQARWAGWVATDAATIRRGDARGLIHFLSAFGGMGSLDDLLFSPANGSASSDGEAALLNARLRHLLEAARSQADALRRWAET
jgi:hypothetical protein